MSEIICAICGSGMKEAGTMRMHKEKWYCDSSYRPNHDCFKRTWEEGSTSIHFEKIKVLCPFDGTDVGELLMNGGEICPTCGAEFSEGYEEIVNFVRVRKQKLEVTK